jgi:anti-sigma B factor antagonist
MNYSRRDDGDATTLQIRGELDALSAGELRPLLDRVVEDGRRNVTVDLSQLRLVDSSGVGALVSLYKRVRASGGQVEFINVTGQPLVIFKLLRLDVVFELNQPAAAAEESRAVDAVEAVEAAPASIRVVRF